MRSCGPLATFKQCRNMVAPYASVERWGVQRWQKGNLRSLVHKATFEQCDSGNIYHAGAHFSIEVVSGISQPQIDAIFA